MQGTLQVNSVPGQGSLFRVEILAEAVPTENLSVINQPTVIGYCRIGEDKPLRILVVDDLVDNRQVLRYLLEPLGFIVEEAENGQQCLDFILENDQPDMILMDLRMPQINGLQASRALRAQEFKRPIIVLSASTLADDHTASLEAGCTAHLAKPIRLPELLETLAQWLPLKWKYASTSNFVEEQIETLSMEYISQFSHLIKMGDMLALEEFAEQLEETYPRFAKKLGQLVSSFKIKDIQELAQRCEKSNNATSVESMPFS